MPHGDDARPGPGHRPRLGLVTAAALLVLSACGGGAAPPEPGPPAIIAPAALSYAVDPAIYRDQETITPNNASVTGGSGTFSVQPALPAGLLLDLDTGRISGTPTGTASTASYVVTVTNGAGFAEATISVTVAPALPSDLAFLAPGFAAEAVHQGGNKIGKCALSPDGRLLYTEVNTGDVRVVDPQVGLLAVPYVDLDVIIGGHRGLLGLVLDPDFVNNGYLYVMATVDGGVGADKSVVLRFTDDPIGNVGTNMVTKVDALPMGAINNGCDLLFDLDGHLLVSIGDIDDTTTAQADAGTSLAGKVLRYDVFDPASPDAAATIPTDNPDPASPEWCRGIRNIFGMALHPVSGAVIGGDNGPTNNDELNLLEAGKNYEWGAVAPVPAGTAGRRLQRYPEVIVPTALTWYDGAAWGAQYENNLFLTSYADQIVRRFEMSGPRFTEIDDEFVFAEFALVADDNKPLDIFTAPDGSLYVSTFTGIWRIWKL